MSDLGPKCAPKRTSSITLGYRFAASDANALRTSAWETPNARAIWDGLTPALKAARTAFAFPAVKEDAAVLTGPLCELAFGSPEVLPRRFCSVSTAESNLSKSRSSSCLIALGKSPGRICRVFEVARVTPAAGFAREEAARADVREKRSGVVALARMRPSCRCRPCAATQNRASQGSLSLINFFASSGDLIRPLRGTFVYTALAFDKVGKPFGIRFELVGISQ
jgi:hypothetical protein